MNRERAKYLLPFIQAYAEGKALQCKHPSTARWQDLEDDPSFRPDSLEYRIKPEPEMSVKYRRFLVRQSNGKCVVCNTWGCDEDDAPQPQHAGFVRWIDTEWQYEEVGLSE